MKRIFICLMAIYLVACTKENVEMEKNHHYTSELQAEIQYKVNHCSAKCLFSSCEVSSPTGTVNCHCKVGFAKCTGGEVVTFEMLDFVINLDTIPSYSTVSSNFANSPNPNGEMAQQLFDQIITLLIDGVNDMDEYDDYVELLYEYELFLKNNFTESELNEILEIE